MGIFWDRSVANGELLADNLSAGITFPITMGCWFSWNVSGNQGFLVCLQPAGNGGSNRLALYRFNNTNNAILQATASGSTTNLISANNSTPANEWFSLIGVARSATDRELYINGVSAGTSTVSRDPGSMDRVRIGNRDGGGSDIRINGTIGEVAIWNADMSAYAAQLADAAHPRSPAFYGRENLVFYRSFVSDINGGPMRIGPTLSTVGSAPTIVPHLVGGKGVTFPT